MKPPVTPGFTRRSLSAGSDPVYCGGVTFSHDTELSLQVIVDLVNTAAECGGREALPDPAAVERLGRGAPRLGRRLVRLRRRPVHPQGARALP